MQNRRFTHPTNGADDHVQLLPEHASLKGKIPAMAAGLTDYYLWTAADLLSLDMCSVVNDEASGSFEDRPLPA